MANQPAPRVHAVPRHSFQAGDVLIQPISEGRCAQVYVEEVLSEHAIVVRAVDDRGHIRGTSRRVEGERLRALVRDPLATRLLRELRPQSDIRQEPGC